MKNKRINGKAYFFVKSFEKRNKAEELARFIRKDGYYARIIRNKIDKLYFQVWASQNPICFYRTGGKG